MSGRDRWLTDWLTPAFPKLEFIGIWWRNESSLIYSYFQTCTDLKGAVFPIFQARHDRVSVEKRHFGVIFFRTVQAWDGETEYVKRPGSGNLLEDDSNLCNYQINQRAPLWYLHKTFLWFPITNPNKEKLRQIIPWNIFCLVRHPWLREKKITTYTLNAHNVV